MAQISFEGNIGRDPELKFTSNGKAVLTFAVAENHNQKNPQTGEWETVGTTWREITLWEARAEAAADALHKGARVVVQGEEVTETYSTRDGEQRQKLVVKFPRIGTVPRSHEPQQQAGGWQQQPAQNQAPGGWGSTQGQTGWNAPQGGQAGDPWANTGGTGGRSFDQNVQQALTPNNNDKPPF